jgi:prepilin-type N-terminal cleavage/methylation domain-containing protein
MGLPAAARASGEIWVILPQFGYKSLMVLIENLADDKEATMRQGQTGFTLIEISIVLVIITLLIGGVMKGQELINNAKVTNLVRDFDTVNQVI